MGRRRRPRKKECIQIASGVESEFLVFKTSDVFGRYLEARKDIPKGTLILAEKYLIAGPLRSSDPVCLGCHVEIDIKDPKTPRCPRCSWPICSEACADKVFHKAECKFFVDRNIQIPKLKKLDYGLIAVLRGLLLKINDPPSWEKLILLQSHNEERMLLPLWKENEENVLSVICDEWKLRTLFSPEEVHNVCGILEVNALEMGETFSYLGIFPNIAMLAHNCTPNVSQFENSVDGILQIRATVDITSGSPIYLSYAYSLQPTPQRRKMLLDTKFFHCACQRCSDPTENGSHLNSLVCQKCKSGFLLSEANGKFRICNKCQNRVNSEALDEIRTKFEIMSQNLPDIESREKFLRDCLPIFHPNHFIPFGVKFNLCQAYGRRNVAFLDLSQKDLERKSELCSDVLNVLNLIFPGYNITRGLVLYEYQATEIMLARRVFETRKYNKDHFRRKLQNILAILLESVTIFQFSYPGSDEYKMGQAAQEDTVVCLQRWIASLK